MEKEFDQEEWDQRNKNKPVELPKLDPKARKKQKKEPTEVEMVGVVRNQTDAVDSSGITGFKSNCLTKERVDELQSE